MTSPDMMATGDRYYADQQLMDFRLLSTFGFTDEEAQAIAARPEVAEVMAGYGLDLLMEDPEGAQVVRLMSLPSDTAADNPAYLNQLVLEEGRLPTAPNECLADSKSGYEIGAEIVVSDENSEDSLEQVAEKCFTVVGLGRSPSYIAVQRGNSSIGNGRVAFFMYVTADAFDSEYYTEIFLSAAGAKGLSAFSDEYTGLIDTGVDALEAFGEQRAQLRYDDIVAEAQEELDDARRELADGKQELAEAEQELADAEEELADGRLEAQREFAKAWIDIKDGEKQLEDGKAALAEGEQALVDAENELVDGQRQLDEGRQKLEAGQREYDAGYAQFAPEKQAYDEASAAVDQLLPAVAALPDMLAALDAMTAGGATEPTPDMLPAFADAATGTIQTAAGTSLFLRGAAGEQGAALADQLDAVAAGASAALAEVENSGALPVWAALQPLQALQPAMVGALQAVQAELDAALPQLQAAEATLAAAKAELDAGWAEIAANQQKLADGRRQLEDGKRQMEEARALLAEAETELADGRRAYYDEKAKAEQELADAEMEIADGWREVEDARRDIADAEVEIADGQQELDDLEQPEWYVFTREDNPGYAGFTSDTTRIDAIAVVIPSFFFLVAALVCLTTMTRMVEEQRPLIGTLKGLGYTSGSIAFKFLLYAGVASTLGALVGVLVGYIAFPLTIWHAYGMLYQMPGISLWNDLPLAVTSVLVSVLCILVATWAACAKELRSVPANLLRPKAPRAGKRVFLERIGPLWRRMGFMQKVAARNLLRYKKRFFMTVVGVAGCSALLLTGFGLRDSITGIVTRQYSDINQYDLMVVLTGQSEEGANTAFNEAWPQYGDALYTDSVRVDAQSKSGRSGDMSVYLFVAERPEDLTTFIDLHQRASGEKIAFPNPGGAVVTEKLADRLDLSIGDSFTVNRVNEGPVSLAVGGITENYIFNYIYITPAEYEGLFGEAPQYGTVLINLAEDYQAREGEVMRALLNTKPVAGIQDVPSLREQFDDMFESLDAVVWLVIGAAAMLAFVVLYNLTNINITERTREIATLKVLGFYNGEVASYIYRENLILTLIGIVAGLVLGVFLHEFVIITAEVDEVMFRRTIEWFSYAFSVVFTLLCAGLVNIVMLRRLRSVDMVESLKSNE